jgi:hypothetical protein
LSCNYYISPYWFMKLLLSKILKLTYWTALFVVPFFVLQTFADTWQTDLNLEIAWWGLTIGNPANYNFGTVWVSVDDQIITWQFTDYFWLEDLEGSNSWYFTTIQCNGLKSNLGNTLTGIYLKQNNLTKLLWVDNPRVKIQSVFLDYYTINKPVTYLYRNPETNYWTISKYWDIPFLKIVIPWGTAPWTYVWTITFTLYV